MAKTIGSEGGRGSKRDRKCDKVRYRAKSDALSAMTLVRRAIGSQSAYVPQSVYYCKRCRGFHLTSMTQDDYRQKQGL